MIVGALIVSQKKNDAVQNTIDMCATKGNTYHCTLVNKNIEFALSIPANNTTKYSSNTPHHIIQGLNDETRHTTRVLYDTPSMTPGSKVTVQYCTTLHPLYHLFLGSNLLSSVKINEDSSVTLGSPPPQDINTLGSPFESCKIISLHVNTNDGSVGITKLDQRHDAIIAKPHEQNNVYNDMAVTTSKHPSNTDTHYGPYKRSLHVVSSINKVTHDYTKMNHTVNNVTKQSITEIILKDDTSTEHNDTRNLLSFPWYDKHNHNTIHSYYTSPYSMTSIELTTPAFTNDNTAIIIRVNHSKNNTTYCTDSSADAATDIKVKSSNTAYSTIDDATPPLATNAVDNTIDQ